MRTQDSAMIIGAKRLAIGLALAVAALAPTTGPLAATAHADAASDACRYVKHWLDTHNPNSAKWRQVVLLWADGCL
jgi:hypothetical protein